MYEMKYQLKYVFIVDTDTLYIIIYVQFSFVYKRRDCRQITWFFNFTNRNLFNT